VRPDRETRGIARSDLARVSDSSNREDSGAPHAVFRHAILRAPAGRPGRQGSIGGGSKVADLTSPLADSEETVVSTVQLRRWTRDEFQQIAESGVLRPDERVELIEGEIFELPPQLSYHATGVCLAQDALRDAFGAGFVCRAQLPLALGQRSQPEPDVAVVPGTIRDFANAHPTTALLVVEVSEATLSFDRDTKGSLYASAGIPEYWIVNLVHRQLELYRDPAPIPETRYGFGYRTRIIALSGELVDTPSPTGARVAVDDLLP
jgi:Uma2 family endonuclease